MKDKKLSNKELEMIISSCCRGGTTRIVGEPGIISGYECDENSIILYKNELDNDFKIMAFRLSPFLEDGVSRKSKRIILTKDQDNILYIFLQILKILYETSNNK